jgi:hypothetical protein
MLEITYLFPFVTVTAGFGFSPYSGSLGVRQNKIVSTYMVIIRCFKIINYK